MDIASHTLSRNNRRPTLSAEVTGDPHYISRFASLPNKTQPIKALSFSNFLKQTENTVLPQKQTIGHVLDPCCIGGGIIKSNRVSNLSAQLIIAFLRYTLCYCNSCHSSRLGDANDFTILTKPSIMQKLWQLCTRKNNNK